MFYYEKEIKTSNSNCLEPSSEISVQLWINTQLCTTLYQQAYCIPHIPKTCHLKGTVHPKDQNNILLLIPWCYLSIYIVRVWVVQLKWCSTAMSLSRNHDPVTQDKPQTLWWACRNYCLSTKLHHADGSLHLLMVERLALVTPQGGDINSVLLGWRKQLLHEAAHNRVCGLS